MPSKKRIPEQPLHSPVFGENQPEGSWPYSRENPAPLSFHGFVADHGLLQPYLPSSLHEQKTNHGCRTFNHLQILQSLILRKRENSHSLTCVDAKGLCWEECSIDEQTPCPQIGGLELPPWPFQIVFDKINYTLVWGKVENFWCTNGISAVRLCSNLKL